jgi:glycosyl transferase family 8
MRAFFEWFSDNRIDPNEPWLMLGKGPSFAKRVNYDLSAFHTLSLNHAVREEKVRVAHVIDYNVIDDCAEAILNNAEVLAMPWRPHVRFVSGPDTLEDLVRRNPILRQMNEQGRLVWYNLSTAGEPRENSPVVHAEFFSAEAGLNLLALAGACRVRSLGVDGGREYSGEFDDLKDKTLLSCGQDTFDKQFKGFARTISTTGVDYAPLDVDSPMRIYVGATEAQMLSCKVLEHSIRKHASMTVEIIPLHLAQINIPQPSDEKNRPRTPFSFQRFLIPALNKYRGRAIYLDSDMLVFGDIRRLWNLPLDDVELLATSSPDLHSAALSVLVLNCSALDWDIERIVERLNSGLLSYEQLMFEQPARKMRASIGTEWNSLEHFKPGRTALLHYTNMDSQPWLSRSNSLNRLWMEELFEAMDDGEITIDEIEEDAALGHVRPSLVYQAKCRIPDSRKLNKKARQLDEAFGPPHAVRQHPRAFQSVTSWMRSVIRFDHS